MEPVILTCINPTKTFTKGKQYKGKPVRKYDHGSNFYNKGLGRHWEQCSIHNCTSFMVKDDIDIVRYISKKRFTY